MALIFDFLHVIILSWHSLDWSPFFLRLQLTLTLVVYTSSLSTEYACTNRSVFHRYR